MLAQPLIFYYIYCNENQVCIFCQFCGEYLTEKDLCGTRRVFSPLEQQKKLTCTYGAVSVCLYVRNLQMSRLRSNSMDGYTELFKT